MQRIKKGDIVGRKSYGKDIFFIVERILKIKRNKELVILKGVTIRIVADSLVEDLELIDKRELSNIIKASDIEIENRIKINYYQKKEIQELSRQRIYMGTILHLDGDKRYSQKAYKYYNKVGLKSVVKNISESKQAQIVIPLLNKFNPDILIITGHDAMIKNGTNYNNIYNYRNSRHFINTVKQARKWAKNSDKLVIFAGACQSYYEEIIAAGADFASSPGRILIDFVDPLIVAEKIAITENYKIVTSCDIAKEIKEGTKGISGVGARGKKRIMI